MTHTSGEAFLCPGTPGSLTSGVEGKEKEEKKKEAGRREKEGAGEEERLQHQATSVGVSPLGLF